MNRPDRTQIQSHLELLHSAAFGCVDARLHLTEDNDPLEAYRKISASIRVLEEVRDDLGERYGFEEIVFGDDEPRSQICPVCDAAGGCPTCRPEEY